jgi:hypothetical protein
MATYSKTHKSEKALKSHVAKIKARGGKATVKGKTIEYKFGGGGNVNSNYVRGKNYPVKTISVKEGEKLGLSEFPNFSSSGSISGMKKIYYGKDALLVKSGKYIYNVTSSPDIYFNI